ncbi:MAG: CBS domain-containing protein [Myxococcota bacterium]|nr:CBS domain-containing protein [Myxococcota bacterium]
MSVGAICTRVVQVMDPQETVLDAARLMQKEEVGTVVVVGPGRRPLGIVSDRDVTVRCVAEGRDPAATPLREVMTGPVAGVSEATPIEDALQRMAGMQTRRLLVVDREGALVGVLSLDDVLELLAEEAVSIGRVVGRPKGAGS